METRPDPLTLVATGDAVGQMVWFHERCFEVLGRWSVDEREATVAASLATWSRWHGEHAAALARHLPDRHGLDPRSLVAPASPPLAAMVDGWVTVAGTAPRVELAASAARASIDALDELVAGTPAHAGAALTRVAGAVTTVLRAQVAAAAALGAGAAPSEVPDVVRDPA